MRRLALSFVVLRCTSPVPRGGGESEAEAESESESEAEAEAESESESESESEAEAEAEAESESESESEAESEAESEGCAVVDCAPPSRGCAEVAGHPACLDPPAPEATSCSNRDLDRCCSSSNCTDGTGGCYFGWFFCGGAIGPEHNQCLYDQCRADADCRAQPHGVCIPGGAFGAIRNVCSYGQCAGDADCGSGGRCAALGSPCCGTTVPPTFVCVTPDSPCDDTRPCRDGGQCQPARSGRGTECAPAVCPA